jgi:2-polyprenyl-6-methoxyphenol hydroxylase-like FAD-dependent oxidoreductase
MAPSLNHSEVLIVGAGPTGLVLALWLAKSGIRPRIIEKSAGPGLASRAMAVQARTLEFYRQLGIDQDVVGRGLKMSGIRMRRGGRLMARFDFGNLGTGISAFPYVVSFPQDDHERLLLEKLKDVGVEVEWNTELMSFQDTGDRVRTKLRASGTDTDTEAEYSYLCGCDGAHSTVRHGLGIGFTGGTYPLQFFVADVAAAGPAADGNVNGCFGINNLCLVFPIRSTGMCRLIGILPTELAGRDDLTFEDVRGPVTQLIGLQVDRVNWFSTYHIHHRVADRFHVGRAFIAGDAGHVHSPVGGQGMNTGIGDAVNLAWKLAAILQKRADPSILETYEAERIRYARSLVATTDRAFAIVVGRGMAGRAFRQLFVPYILPLALRFQALRRMMFRLISQTQIEYTPSPLSVGHAGKVRGGNRLPWVAELANFEPLQSLDWQIHVYGIAVSGLKDAAQRAGIPMHEFAWRNEAGRAGLTRDALYLIRPDGYVALVEPRQDAARLGEYLSKFAIKIREPAGSVM